MLPVLEVSDQLQRGLQLSSGVFLNVDVPLLNVVCVRSVRLSGGGGQLLSSVVMKADYPSLSVACGGSVRPTSRGGLHLSSGVFF